MTRKHIESECHFTVLIFAYLWASGLWFLDTRTKEPRSRWLHGMKIWRFPKMGVSLNHLFHFWIFQPSSYWGFSMGLFEDVFFVAKWHIPIDLRSEEFSPISLTVSKPLEKTRFWGRPRLRTGRLEHIVFQQSPRLWQFLAMCKPCAWGWNRMVFGGAAGPRISAPISDFPSLIITSTINCGNLDLDLKKPAWNFLKDLKLKASKVFQEKGFKCLELPLW